MGKFGIIPYIYDFSKYNSPDPYEVEKIKSLYPCTLRLIMVSRMIRLKRHHVVLPVILRLITEGYDIKLLLLDDGPERKSIERYIVENSLQNHVFLLGFRKDFINYMAASDLLIQPSLTDASNSVAKEMGVLEKAVAVSRNVGDYDDYIEDNTNGYFIPLKKSGDCIYEIIIDAYNNPEKLKSMGKKLKHEILHKFGHAEASMRLYEKLLNQ